MPKCVLLCDDEQYILRAAEFRFRRSGFEVYCACDGEDGWEKIQQRAPDIVVTDCQMPRLDGVGLAKRIHDDEKLTHIPVIMLTAKGFELSAERLRAEYGVLAVISKPFSPRELHRTVEHVLETGQVPQPTLSYEW